VVYKPFTHLLQVFTAKMFQDIPGPISSLYWFTKLDTVMKIIYKFAFLLLLLFSFACSEQNQKTEKAGTAQIVFRSTDGGESWEDISKGLPESLQKGSIRGNSFYTNDKGLFLKFANGLYRSTANVTAPFWTKETSADEHSSMDPGKPGVIYWGANLKKTNGTSVWSPIFENFQRPGLRTVFETADGAIFIGTDRGFFKTANDGKTWKQVHAGDLVGNLDELNGVMLATSMRRIIRSTDKGETWAVVTGDTSMAFDVKQIKGGFAAITASSESGARSLRTSYDGGKTWQAIDATSQDKIDSIKRTWNDRPFLKRSMTSIIQVGGTYFCTHPEGIFRSIDKGKTWKLLLPAVKGKVFSLFVSGNVVYAIASKPGC
jgi:photosystem II stability/assembly factor-like uncharacterized protein